MSKYNLTAQSELMQNYHPGDVLSPEGRFIALQTNTGTSLLLSKGTDDILYVTKEVQGDRHGWTRTALSRELVKNPKKLETEKHTCKIFAAAQSVYGADKAVIQLAMVVNDGTEDLLHLSLGNSDSDTSWADSKNSPKWTACPFNAKLDSSHQAPSPFLIADVFIGEASDKEYIVADVVRDPHSEKPSIVRYFIDASNPGAPQWQLHDLDFDLDKDRYSTCLGRRTPSSNSEKRHPVDGLYTTGVVNGAPQFFYVPLHSAFGKPESSKLQLTPAGDVRPDAIAACRKADNTSDLYATGGGRLYYFPSNRQVMIDGEAAAAVPLIKHRMFSAVSKLFASVSEETVTVWGLNASDEVFYTTCPIGQEGTLGSWSTPLPIRDRVEHLSPYINRQNGANTFFMHAGGKLMVARKLSRTEKESQGAGTWKVQELAVAPSEKVQRPPAQSFRSYTTRIRVTGSEDKRATAGVPVSIKAPGGVAGLYINHRYYSAGPDPIKVKTDATGCITVVEPTTRLDGTQIEVEVEGDGGGMPVNPFEKSPTVRKKLEKLADKNTDLKTLTYRDQRGKQFKLVRADAKPADVAAAHANYCNLWEAHRQKVGGHATHANFLANYSTAPTKDNRSEAYKKFVGTGTAVPADAGDLLSMLEGRQRHVVMGNARLAASGESFWEMLVDFFVDLGKIIWKLIVKIADAIYEIFIDTIELIWNAITFVLDAILELGAEALLEFAMWLVDFDKVKAIQTDMKKWTQKVIKDQVDAIPGMQKAFDDRIGGALAALKNWAPNLGEPGKQKVGDLSAQDQGEETQDPAAMLLTHAVSEYYGDMVSDAGQHFPDASSSPLDALWSALDEEAATLGTAFGDLKQLAQDAPKMTVEAVLAQLIRILGEAVLKSVKTVVDAILKILYALAKKAMDWLLTDIHIPVVSDALAEWGITRFDVLDLLCYAAAVPASLVFDFESKPVPANNLATSSNVAVGVGDSGGALSDKATAQRFAGLHFSAGFCGLIATYLFAAAEMVEGIAVQDASAVTKTMVGAAWFFNLGSEAFQLSAIASIPDTQIQDESFRVLLWTVLGVQMAVLLTFNPFWFLLGEAEIKNPTAQRAAARIFGGVFEAVDSVDAGVLILWVGDVIDAILVIPEFVATCAHFKELAQQTKTDERDLGIVDEVGNLMSFITRVLRPIAFVIPGGIPKAAVVVAGSGTSFTYSVMQMGEGFRGWAVYQNRQNPAVV